MTGTGGGAQGKAEGRNAAEFDVFLSYNSKDKDAVEELVKALRRRLLRTSKTLAKRPKPTPTALPDRMHGVSCSGSTTTSRALPIGTETATRPRRWAR